jgi:hypothetical protein
LISVTLGSQTALTAWYSYQAGTGSVETRMIPAFTLARVLPSFLASRSFWAQAGSEQKENTHHHPDGVRVFHDDDGEQQSSAAQSTASTFDETSRQSVRR